MLIQVYFWPRRQNQVFYFYPSALAPNYSQIWFSFFPMTFHPSGEKTFGNSWDWTWALLLCKMSSVQDAALTTRSWLIGLPITILKISSRLYIKIFATIFQVLNRGSISSQPISGGSRSSRARSLVAVAVPAAPVQARGAWRWAPRWQCRLDQLKHFHQFPWSLFILIPVN